MMEKKDIVDLGRFGLLREASLQPDGSFTLEAMVPRLPFHTYTIPANTETHELLLFLTDLKTPGSIFNMFELANDKSSRLYRIPKELYEEDTV